MAVYSVHLPGAPGQKPDAADAAFVREGFSGAAFFFGPFWLLARGLWLSAALWCVAILILLSVVAAGALSSDAALTLALLLQVFLGLEASRLIENKLWRKGYDLAEIVAAPHLEEAEMTFYRELGAKGEAAPQRLAPPRPGAALVIGSFPTREG
ncbi:MAG: DUF2628 domain-containing protein [Methylocella sp.]